MLVGGAGRAVHLLVAAGGLPWASSMLATVLGGSDSSASNCPPPSPAHPPPPPLITLSRTLALAFSFRPCVSASSVRAPVLSTPLTKKRTTSAVRRGRRSLPRRAAVTTCRRATPREGGGKPGCAGRLPSVSSARPAHRRPSLDGAWPRGGTRTRCVRVRTRPRRRCASMQRTSSSRHRTMSSSSSS